MSAAEVTGLSETNADWQARKNAAMARGEGNVASVFIERGLGSELWDVERKRYIDFGTGIAVCNTGHRHPKVMAAVAEQLERFTHTCVMVTPYDSAVRLAEQLNRLAPGPSPKKTMFVTTGAEAVENAIKIARSHTGRRGIIAFDGGYHGRTLMTLGLTGKVSPYKNRFGPFPGDIWRAPFPVSYHGISVADSLLAVDTLFKTDVAPEDCAAIILEPVQGEGGFYPAPDEFMRGLRTICDKHGIMLIADEIQSGFARTGKFFASEYSGIEPDMVTIAKGLAGGFPLAAVTGKAEIMDAVAPGGLGGTYAGSPVGCAAALAVIDVIESENLTARATQIASVFKNRLSALQREYPNLIGEIRAERGAMVAIELVHERDPSKPNPALAKAILVECYAQGLVVLTCGMDGNVFRFLPALTISDALLEEGLAIFEGALKKIVDG